MAKNIGAARYIELSEAKKHLRVEPSFTDEDTYIYALIDAAETIAERDLCSPLTDFLDDAGKLIAPIRIAILLLVAHFYETRTPVIFGTISTEVPQSYKSLIARWINFAG